MEIFPIICNPFQENTFIVSDETNECFIIDCGCYTEDERQKLKQYISEKGLSVKRLINTHLHLDHVFGHRFIFDTYGIKPEATQADEFLLSHITQQANMFGVPYNEKAVSLGGYLNEGEIIKVGNMEFEILSIQGHSPGGLAFYNKKECIVFVGDSIFRNSIGRTDLPMGNYEDLINDLRTKILTLPLETVIVSGHGPFSTVEMEIANNPYLK